MLMLFARTPRKLHSPWSVIGLQCENRIYTLRLVAKNLHPFFTPSATLPACSQSASCFRCCNRCKAPRFRIPLPSGSPWHRWRTSQDQSQLAFPRVRKSHKALRVCWFSIPHQLAPPHQPVVVHSLILAKVPPFVILNAVSTHSPTVRCSSHEVSRNLAVVAGDGDQCGNGGDEWFHSLSLPRCGVVGGVQVQH